MGETEDLLGKLLLAEDVRPSPRKRTLAEYRQSWESRTRAHQRLSTQKRLGEGYLPSDEVDYEKDVAFGITKQKRRFLSADMVTDEHGQPPKRMGTISHIGLLVAAGFAKSTDEKPGDDYACRGIVKPKLGGRVIFWETTPELTTARLAPFVKDCIEELLKRHLIQLETEVYGANEDVAVATAEEIKRDW
jgi:hypothetical protein